jgi:uncharacterized membrane protein YeaQ/YmgE (transglycosylase-associated protein family)
MDLVITLFVGGITGWLAILVEGTDPRRGALAHILAGVVGSVLALWPAGALEVTAGPARWLISLAGAILLVALVRALGPARRRAA